ncbi:MAG: hypothetical protein QNJ15_05530 [Erythrobacter sp.]|nr:hypothetical protein [Erythrobacter sp.]
MKKIATKDTRNPLSAEKLQFDSRTFEKFIETVYREDSQTFRREQTTQRKFFIDRDALQKYDEFARAAFLELLGDVQIGFSARVELANRRTLQFDDLERLLKFEGETKQPLSLQLTWKGFSLQQSEFRPVGGEIELSFTRDIPFRNIIDYLKRLTDKDILKYSVSGSEDNWVRDKSRTLIPHMNSSQLPYFLNFIYAKYFEIVCLAISLVIAAIFAISFMTFLEGMPEPDPLVSVQDVEAAASLDEKVEVLAKLIDQPDKVASNIPSGFVALVMSIGLAFFSFVGLVSLRQVYIFLTPMSQLALGETAKYASADAALKYGLWKLLIFPVAIASLFLVLS